MQTDWNEYKDQISGSSMLLSCVKTSLTDKVFEKAISAGRIYQRFDGIECTWLILSSMLDWLCLRSASSDTCTSSSRSISSVFISSTPVSWARFSIKGGIEGLKEELRTKNLKIKISSNFYLLHHFIKTEIQKIKVIF